MLPENTIVFPALDLSIEWADGTILDIVLVDNRCNFTSEEKFTRFLKGHIVADCNGNIYKVKGKTNLSKWRRFVPFTTKAILEFEFQNRNMTLEEIKAILIEKSKDLLGEAYAESVRKAKSIKELMNG